MPAAGLGKVDGRPTAGSGLVIRAFWFDRFGVLEHSYLMDAYRRFGGDPDGEADFIRGAVSRAHVDPGASVQRAFAERFGVSVEEWLGACRREPRYDARLLRLVDWLRSRGYGVGMLTDSSADSDGLWDLAPSLDCIVVSALEGMRKDQEAIFERAAQRLGVPVEACVMVDDTPANCKAAERAGMQAIVYTTFEEVLDRIQDLLRPQDSRQLILV